MNTNRRHFLRDYDSFAALSRGKTRAFLPDQDGDVEHGLEVAVLRTGLPNHHLHLDSVGSPWTSTVTFNQLVLHHVGVYIFRGLAGDKRDDLFDRRTPRGARLPR